MLERLNEAEKRFDAIEADLANPDVMSDIEKYTALMKDRASLAPIIEKFREYKKAASDAEGARELMETESDPEMHELAEEEYKTAKADTARLEEELKILLLPRDPMDEKNVVIEIRAGAGGDEAALGKGPGLMFITLPKVFDSMKGGSVIGALFFLLVLFAALTSSISLMETVVSFFQDKFHWGRKFTSAVVFVFCLLMGIPSSLGNGVWADIRIFGFQFLDFFDFISNSVMMPVVAFLTCIFVGYCIKPKALIDEIAQGGKFKSEKLFVVIIKYVAPVCIVLILVSSILDVLGIMKI